MRQEAKGKTDTRLRTETGDKIHMLDMFQITEAFDRYKGSMEKVGKALEQYSDNTLKCLR